MVLIRTVGVTSNTRSRLLRNGTFSLGRPLVKIRTTPPDLNTRTLRTLQPRIMDHRRRHRALTLIRFKTKGRFTSSRHRMLNPNLRVNIRVLGVIRTSPLHHQQNSLRRANETTTATHLKFRHQFLRHRHHRIRPIRTLHVNIFLRRQTGFFRTLTIDLNR